MARINPKNGKQWHIDLDKNDVGEYVFLPGDPFRTDLIAGFLDDAKIVAHKREHKTWTGYLDGVKVSVTSTGMGSPSASIAVEELINCGAHTFIRIGTAGRVSEESKDPSYDGVIVTGAVRDEGTTVNYVPIEFPAMANLDVLNALVEASKSKNKKYLLGIAHSKDSYYAQHEPDSMPNSDYLLSRWKAWEKAGVACSEMETAGLFIVGAVRGVRTGAIMAYKDMNETIDVAKEALRLLIKQDNK